ncbi:MAG TPA: hypothetical protein VFU59_10535, partial [Candidatus Eisenbacteria bacterium]|nr:hypothetical protein [Candidatus Eisenbacteria bacterium]
LVLLAAAQAAPANAAASAAAETGGAATEIRLGDAPPPPPAVDPSRANAVERYLAARQSGSIARSKGRAVKLPALPPGAATAEELYGPTTARLVAFDFTDESIESAGPGRFQVTTFLLFADGEGRIVESRDESLLFTRAGAGWTCASRKTTAAMSWSSDGVFDSAAALGVSDELRRAEAHLREWIVGPRQAFAYSVADVAKERDGRVVVQCLRFTADPGKRGFDVDSAPLVFSRDSGTPRIESN